MARATFIISFVVLATAIFFFDFPALAQEEIARPALKKQVYTYEEMGRRDPFISLIRPAKEERVLTGIPLLDYDVSQMRVIAIAWDKSDRYALFRLPDGKFYTIKEGMKIGIHNGKVEEILRDAVMIREIKPDFKGVPRPIDTYLRLREEEGQ